MAVERPKGEPREILAIRGIGKTTNAFRWALVEMADRLGVDPSHIAATMAIESGFDPRARNPSSGAVGLVQFMPFYLRAQKPPLSPSAVQSMSAIRQLALVERFYRPHAKKMRTPCDAYMATFLPAFVGFPETTVVGRKDSSERIAPGAPTLGAIYRQNIGFDPKPRQGFFTIGDVCAIPRSLVASAEKKPRIVVTPEAAPAESGGGSGSAGGVAVFLFGLLGTFLLARRKRS